jgi:hypothetical protein
MSNGKEDLRIEMTNDEIRMPNEISMSRRGDMNENLRHSDFIIPATAGRLELRDTSLRRRGWCVVGTFMSTVP